MQHIKDPACPLHSTNQPFAARVCRRRALSLSDLKWEKGARRRAAAAAAAATTPLIIVLNYTMSSRHTRVPILFMYRRARMGRGERERERVREE